MSLEKNEKSINGFAYHSTYHIIINIIVRVPTLIVIIVYCCCCY
jgi:hypothetical protein